MQAFQREGKPTSQPECLPYHCAFEKLATRKVLSQFEWAWGGGQSAPFIYGSRFSINQKSKSDGSERSIFDGGGLEVNAFEISIIEAWNPVVWNQ